MSVTKTYHRPKAAATVSTGIALTIKAAEGATGVHVFQDNMGAEEAITTGVVKVQYLADADPSGSADIQELFNIEITPVLNDNGTTALSVKVTPKLGDNTDGVAKTSVFTHDQNMDVWQTAAGQARA